MRRHAKTFPSDDDWEEMDRRAARYARMRALAVRAALFAALAAALYAMVRFVALHAPARRYDAWGQTCEAFVGNGSGD